MSGLTDLAALQALGVAAFTTSDAAAVLGASSATASQSLRRAASLGLVTRVRHGLWTFDRPPDPLRLLAFVTAPYPSYVSLQSALAIHGLVEQIPSSTFAVTLGRSAHLHTEVGDYHLHHVVPEFFGGFEVGPTGVRCATPEKALVDVLYLSSTKDRRFARLPELTLSESFKPKVARTWVRRIPSNRLRTLASQRLEELLDAAAH